MIHYIVGVFYGSFIVVGMITTVVLVGEQIVKYFKKK